MVTKVGFQAVYDWIIFRDEDVCEILSRSNILEVFRAAKYLKMKGKIFMYVRIIKFALKGKLCD